MDDRVELQDPHGLEQIAGADDVAIEGVGRRVEARGHERLRGQVEDHIGPGLAKNSNQGAEIAQIAVVEFHLVEDAPDVVLRAAPALDPANFRPGVFGEDVFRQVASDKSGNSRDEGFHIFEFVHSSRFDTSGFLTGHQMFSFGSFHLRVNWPAWL